MDLSNNGMPRSSRMGNRQVTGNPVLRELASVDVLYGQLECSCCRPLEGIHETQIATSSASRGSNVAIGLSWLKLRAKQPKPKRIWSVGPLTKGTPVMGISFGTSGAMVTGPHVDTQTSSIFAATRSVVFAGDRIVLASRVGMRKVERAQVPTAIYQLLSLDAQSGKVKGTREFLAFNSLKVFATNDAHVIVSGRDITRLTPDLKDAGSLEFDARGHKSGTVEDISPDGSTLGNATSPGFEMIDT
jgi:hypothetical protein